VAYSRQLQTPKLTNTRTQSTLRGGRLPYAISP
jgi:hypothetical protein